MQILRCAFKCWLVFGTVIIIYIAMVHSTANKKTINIIIGHRTVFYNRMQDQSAVTTRMELSAGRLGEEVFSQLDN